MFDEKKENLNPAAPEEAASEAAAAENTGASSAEPEAPKAQKEKKDKPKKFGVWLHSTRFKHGSLASVFVVGVLVLAVLLNVGATALVQRFPSLRLDMTADRRLSLNEDFTDLIDQIDVPTEIIFCAEHDSVENNVNNIMGSNVGGTALNEGTRLLELVSKAAERNGNITVSFVDIEKNPGFTSEFPEEEINPYSIIIRSAKRSKVLAVNDLYKSGQDASGNRVVASNIEYTIGNAMLAVNVDKLPVVGVLEGHGETEPATLTALLKDNNFEVQPVDLMLAQPIDSAVDVLIINAPTGDYTPEQIKILEDFLLNDENYNKNIVVSLSPMQDTDHMPNFRAFMEDWGIGLQQSGSVVVESDRSHYMQIPLLPFLEFEADTMFQEHSSGIVLGDTLAPIEVLWESHGGVAVSTVLSTYDTAYSVALDDEDPYNGEGRDKKSFPAMTVSAKGISGSKVVYSRVITLASAEMFNSGTAMGSTKNSDCAVTLFRYLSGTTGDENKVYIDSTKLTSADFAVSSGLVNVVGMLIFMILIPIAVLAVGLIVWLRRRHL